MFEGRLIAIGIAASATSPLGSVDETEAVAGIGLTGDRYAKLEGTFQRGEIQPSQQVTLIEREALDAVQRDEQLQITHLDSRRNLLTEQVPLNHLVGREFTVGNVVLRGVKLCEPCGHLEGLTSAGVKQALLHRGGLRAEVLIGGTIHVGDPIRARDG